MHLKKLTLFACVALFLFETVASTGVITGTLFTGFIGGFLMGKITLGTLLAVMNRVNQRPTTGPALIVTAAPAISATRNNMMYQSDFVDQEALDIPDSVENEVRDRFLKQLGKMDPLNCLPKVFCEISADPKSSSLFGSDGLGFKFAQQTLSSKKPAKTKTSGKDNKKPSSKRKQQNHSASDEPADDIDDNNDNSDSNSDEDDEPYDEQAEKLKQYEAKENYQLENKALEEMVEEFDDPINYYFILKDKKKNIHPSVMHMMKNQKLDMSRRSFVGHPNDDSSFGKKMGGTADILPQQTTTTTKTNINKNNRRSSSSSIDDIFAADPFFDDFSRSLKFPLDEKSKSRTGRSTSASEEDDDITMGKYKLAGQVAEMKDPRKCRKVFSTCPFTTEEVLNMISKLNAGGDQKTTFKYKVTKKNKKKKNKPDDGMKNLQNTLMAIEKLNDATLLAEVTGQQVDYSRVVEDAQKSNTPSQASAKIIEDFEQIEEKLITKRNGSSKKPNVTKTKRPSTTGKSTKTPVRKRRHDDEPRLKAFRGPVGMGMRRSSRIELDTKINSNKGKLSISNDRDDEFIQPKDKLASKRAQTFSDDESSDESEEDIKIPDVPFVKEKYKTAPPSAIMKDTEKSGEYKRVFEVEDDEVSSPESEEKVVDVQTFSQTFIDTLDRPSKYKPKPRPIHNVVKVKPQTLQRSTTPKPKPVSTSTLKPRKSSHSTAVKQKFSGELEDDEEEAKMTEKEIDDLVSKYKPKEPKH